MRRVRWPYAFAAFLAIPALAARITLQDGIDGYSGTRDTWLDEGNRGRNYGGAPYLVVRYDEPDGGFIEDCTLVRFVLPTVTCAGVASATLELFYFQAGSMYDNNALSIKPYRVSLARDWFENTRNGQTGEGANWRYFGQQEIESNKWTYEEGGWYDKYDDGNSSNRLKRTGGTPPGAIEPTNWVPFDVTQSVRQWVGGAENNGFILFSCGFEGSGNEAYVHFASRETNNPAVRPRLSIQYSGAHIVWTGRQNSVWDTSSTNWLVGGRPGRYDSGDFVRFFDASAQTTVQISGAQSPGGVIVSNHTKHYVFWGGAIGGTGSFWKAGLGACTLATSNSYGGVTEIYGGQLTVLSNGALGNTTGETRVASNAVLELRCHYTAPESLALRGTLAVGTGSNSWWGPIQFSEGARITMTGGVMDILGPLSGTGTVTITGNGLLKIQDAATSSWIGAMIVDAGEVRLLRQQGPVWVGELTVGGTGASTVRVHTSRQFLDYPVRVNDRSRLSFVDFATNYTLSQLTLRGGSVTAGVAVTLSNVCNVEVGSVTSVLEGTYFLAHTGVVFDVAYDPAGSALEARGAFLGGGIRKRGAGTMVLTASNAPAHAWKIEQGVLRVHHPSGLGSAPVWVGDKCTLSFGVNGVWSNALTMDSGATLLADSGAQVTWAGPISVAGADITVKANVATGSRLTFEADQSLPSASWEFSGGGDIVVRGNLMHLDTYINGANVCIAGATGTALGVGTVFVRGNSVLQGCGRLAAAVIVEAGGRLEPGCSDICTLTVSNSVAFRSNATFMAEFSPKAYDVLDLAYGGTLTIDSNATMWVAGIITGTPAVVFVRNARDIRGTFANWPEGTQAPPPNRGWFIHYQPNAIYFSRHERQVAYFRALNVEGQTRLFWRTVVEYDVAGFDVYWEQAPGVWVKLNVDPIPATNHQGGVYSFGAEMVPPESPERFRLVQVLAQGGSNVLVECLREATALEVSAGLGEGKPELRWRSREDETYWIQATTNLLEPFANRYGPIPATPKENRHPVEFESPAEFYRINLEP